MQLIETKTLGTASASIEFTNIPQNFTDIRVVCSLRSSNSLDGQNYGAATLAINGSTANLSRTNLIGLGSGTPESYSGTSISVLTNGSTSTSNTFTNSSIYFPNYAGSTNKSMSFDLVMENNGTLAFQEIMNGLWSQTAAITSLTFTASGSGATLVAGSTISLYGIGGAGDLPAPKATGGIIQKIGDFWVHTFTSSGTFTPTAALSNVDYLVIAGGGGGGGGGSAAGGGGAGGYRSSVTGESSGANSSPESKLSLASGVGYTVTVGAGGSSNASGSNSVFSTITSNGGGAGGFNDGTSGGSGGGGRNGGSSGTTNQGSAGGGGNGDWAGGGGGAGGAGATASYGAGPGAGGTGISSSITGSATFRAGGGGGASTSTSSGAGGNGGGGGGGRNSVAGGAGTVNTGGGGGGGGTNQSGGTGGSGIVIVRYAA